ncbi:javelin-like isoform X2 [Choristoneura fumiferana]|uniref:javelin-like isoform X2 n=1 Tax=Choristoneura fumiferana TaxID=7141 RepID=UPI003D15D5D3
MCQMCTPDIRKTGGADSASGGSGGSGMECMQLRSQPEPFHYLISEQAKSLVALQELQNEVGALLEFRDLVIETFPNLRSKMAPSTPTGGARRDWEPGVRVRRKLAGGGGDASRAKPQPSVQDSGFSTETSCGKDAQSSSASRSRPLEDELWALLDVIQRKGVRLREEAELLRGELDERGSGDTAEESFARVLAGCGECSDVRRLRSERDALLLRAAQLEAEAAATPPRAASSPLGRLDRALETPPRPPRVPTPDSKKFAAILQESNPVELQRQLLSATVQNQVLREWMSRAVKQRTSLLERLEQARDLNEDLKFRLDEKTVELDSVKSRVQLLEEERGADTSPARTPPPRAPREARERESREARESQESRSRSSLERRSHSSMRDMQPLPMPEQPSSAETPRRRPSRIPLHTAHKGAAPRPPAPRPPSAASRGRPSLPPQPPARRPPPQENKSRQAVQEESEPYHDSLNFVVAAEYLARTERLFSRLRPRARPTPALLPEYRLAYESPQNLALELTKSILYENSDSINKSLHSGDSLWNGKPQQYFESMNYAADEAKEYDSDSLAPC